MEIVTRSGSVPSSSGDRAIVSMNSQSNHAPLVQPSAPPPYTVTATTTTTYPPLLHQ